MVFSKKQLGKMADQARLLAWAQGAIFYSDLQLFSKNVTISVVISFWFFFQIVALYADRGE